MRCTGKVFRNLTWARRGDHLSLSHPSAGSDPILRHSPLMSKAIGAIANAENRATVSRLTCNRKPDGQDLDQVRHFLRDVHCPCVARRPHIWEYRTIWFDPVVTLDIPALDGVSLDCPADRSLQFMSDVRWLDKDAHARFSTALPADVSAAMVADVHLLVGESTGYDVAGDNGWTFADRTGVASPLGPVSHPTFGIFLRARSDLAAFHQSMHSMAARWSDAKGVRRVRLNLLDTAAAPQERHYQAMIDLQLEDGTALSDLVADADAETISAIHVHPITHVFTWCREGAPTLAGLRGYAPARAIEAMGAHHQASPHLLGWMYGEIGERIP